MHTQIGDRLFSLFKNIDTLEEVPTFLGWASFLKFMVIILKGSLEEKCELIYGIFDKDHDNSLEKEEIIEFYFEFLKILLKPDRQEDQSFSDLQTLIRDSKSSEINYIILGIANEIFDKYALKDNSNVY